MIGWAILGALVWSGMMGTFNLPNLVCGAALGAIIAGLHRRSIPAEPALRWDLPFRVLKALPFFLWELLTANLQMAREVFRPVDQLRPGIVRVPIEPCSETEKTAVGHWITLTPGTMTMDISEEGDALFIHAMVADDPNSIAEAIQAGPQKRIREVFRP